MMATRVYWIEGPWKGRLAIVPRPRGGEWLRDEVSGWRANGINVVVSFLTSDEIHELELEAEKQICEASAIRFISFAIQDRGVPVSTHKAAALVNDLEQLLSQGETIALHCRQSVGRSALIAAYLLVDSGEEPRSAFERIGSKRGRKVPDTQVQERWVDDRASEDRRSKGARLFERYLHLQGITDYQVEKDRPGRNPSQAYSLSIDREYLFEIKSFRLADILSAGSSDSVTLINQKIEEAQRVFQEYEGKLYSVVLYDNGANLVDLESPQVMFEALDRNNTDSESNNADLSAVITLRYVDVKQKKLAFDEKLIDDTRAVAATSIAE
jgi:Polymorphic toxin system, DSP-PTPase phosphatase